MRSLFARLFDAFRRRTLDRELEGEIATHLELAAADMEARGMSREAARRAALREFGGVARAREADREARGFPALEGLWSAARSGLRGCRRNRFTTGVAIITIALGIGATTAIFSVVYGVLLKPLPFYEPDRLVALYHLMPGWGPGPHGPQSDASYFTYRDHGRVFEDIAVWRAVNVSIIRNGEPEQVKALMVTEGMLSLLGVRLELGRLIRKEDDVPDAPARLVLTHGYWQRTFGGAADVVGRSLTINGTPYEIVGVLPASFKFLETDAQVLLPLKLNRADASPGGGFGPRGVARLKPGVTLSQANDDIARMIPLIPEQFPLEAGLTREMWDGIGLAPNVRPLSEDVTGDVSRPLWILLGTVAVVLLIAWTNVANLLLVRAEGRQSEFAVRQALGASRRRIAGELVSESLSLGLAGGVVGVLFAQAGIGLLRRIAPVALPRVDDIGINGVVLLFSLIISVVTAVLFGLLPAVRFGTLNVQALKDAGRSASDALCLGLCLGPRWWPARLCLGPRWWPARPITGHLLTRGL